MRKKSILIATIIVASFIPAYACAEEPQIERSLALANAFEKDKLTECKGVQKHDCETAFSNVIDSLRALAQATRRHAEARVRGDWSEMHRIDREIIRISEEGKARNAILKKLVAPELLSTSKK